MYRSLKAFNLLNDIQWGSFCVQNNHSCGKFAFFHSNDYTDVACVPFLGGSV